MQMHYFWIGVAVVVLLLDLWVINSVLRSDKASGIKSMWVVLVLLLPVVGVAIWGVYGPRGITKGPSSPEHSKG